MINRYLKGVTSLSQSKYTVAKRSVWYFLRTFAAIVIVFAACVGITITALNISNIYIIATEGMNLRAECILENKSLDELTEYFTVECIDADRPLYINPYKDYSITNFDYRLSVEGVYVLPWGRTGTIKLLERIPSITGTKNVEAEQADAADGADAEQEPKAAVPEWTDARYTITLKQISGRWYISSITVTEENPPEKIKPTPDMSLMPEKGNG